MMIKVAIGCLGLVLVTAIAIPFYLNNIGARQNIPLVAFYPFENANGDHAPDSHWSNFTKDVRLIKDLHFEGLKLFNMHWFYNTSTLEKSLDYIESMKLKVVPTFVLFDVMSSPYNFSQNWFTLNQSKLDAYCDYVANCTLTTRNYDVFYYAVHYPWNWSNTDFFVDIIHENEYKWCCQQIVDAIYQYDTRHEIYMISEGIERYDNIVPPLDLCRIQGFGLEVYPEVQDNYGDEGEHNIDWTFNLYQEQTELALIIDEYGVRTRSYTGETYGLASSEDQKCQMIQDFMHHIYCWDLPWTYFGLYDMWSGDFGLVNDDFTLKESGETMKDVLM